MQSARDEIKQVCESNNFFVAESFEDPYIVTYRTKPQKVNGEPHREQFEVNVTYDEPNYKIVGYVNVVHSRFHNRQLGFHEFFDEIYTTPDRLAELLDFHFFCHYDL